MHLIEIPQAKIREPVHDVRIRIDDKDLEELAESIRTVGLLQPIVVRPIGDEYEVVTGHRRQLATRKLGMDPVTCLVLDPEGAEAQMAQRLHENIYRVDLTPIEEAAVYAELFEQLLDTDKVAAAVRRSRAVVERRLALLELDDRIREALDEKKIPLGVAEELQKVKDETKRHYLLACAISDGATADKVRQWRKEFEPIQFVREGDPLPGGRGALHEMRSADVSHCWLCGSNEDQHAMRVAMIHTYCDRQYRNALLAQQPVGGPDGEPG